MPFWGKQTHVGPRNIVSNGIYIPHFWGLHMTAQCNLLLDDCLYSSAVGSARCLPAQHMQQTSAFTAMEDDKICKVDPDDCNDGCVMAIDNAAIFFFIHASLSGGLLAWLSAWGEVQICMWPSWCHCHSLSLAPIKSRLVLPIWYWLTRVVPDKGLLNGCCCYCYCCCNTIFFTVSWFFTLCKQRYEKSLLVSPDFCSVRRNTNTTWHSAKQILYKNITSKFGHSITAIMLNKSSQSHLGRARC